MSETDLAQLIGRLEGSIASRLDEQRIAIRSVADEVSKLGIRVGSLEREHENIKRRATQSAHDLSEHLHRDESTNDAIKAHMAKFEAALGALTTTNTDQSKRLVRIDRLHPWIMIVAGAIGAAVSGYVHEAVHPPTTTVVPGDAPR